MNHKIQKLTMIVGIALLSSAVPSAQAGNSSGRHVVRQASVHVQHRPRVSVYVSHRPRVSVYISNRRPSVYVPHRRPAPRHHHHH